MSYFPGMLKSNTYQVFEWHINKNGEIAIFSLDEEGKQRNMTVSADAKEQVTHLMNGIGLVVPDVFIPKYNATWDDVLEALNHPKRSVGKIQAEEAWFVVNRLGFKNPIDRKRQGGRWVYSLEKAQP